MSWHGRNHRKEKKERDGKPTSADRREFDCLALCVRVATERNSKKTDNHNDCGEEDGGSNHYAAYIRKLLVQTCHWLDHLNSGNGQRSATTWAGSLRTGKLIARFNVLTAFRTIEFHSSGDVIGGCR